METIIVAIIALAALHLPLRGHDPARKNSNATTSCKLLTGFNSLSSSALLALITKPLGLYLDAGARCERQDLARSGAPPLERLTYRVMGVDPDKEQDWKQYTLAMLLFSLVGCLFTYADSAAQHLLPLNPQGSAGLSEHLAFNTAVSFTTNTNWQSYGGEATMSYFSQMVGLTFHNFVSAATGIAIAAALVRGIARHSAKTLGNFWVDLVRVTYYLLLPICLVFAVFLVSQGMIQNFKPYTKAKLVEPYKISGREEERQGRDRARTPTASR